MISSSHTFNRKPFSTITPELSGILLEMFPVTVPHCCENNSQCATCNQKIDLELHLRRQNVNRQRNIPVRFDSFELFLFS